jgi:hypothetical protein
MERDKLNSAWHTYATLAREAITDTKATEKCDSLMLAFLGLQIDMMAQMHGDLLRAIDCVESKQQ